MRYVRRCTGKTNPVSFFFAGLLFALTEFGFAIWSHSASALMDAAYDAAELIFIVLILFLTPLFHEPISEKHPYGFSQGESLFLIIKGFMMLAVSVSLTAHVVETILSGGFAVDGRAVALFQLFLGAGCILVFSVMKRMDRQLASPTVQAELLGWRIDIVCSLGMSAAFFASILLGSTSLAPLLPYFDSVIALALVAFTLPDSLRLLWRTARDVLLFSPDAETVQRIRGICDAALPQFGFRPVFHDITRTGRRLWVSVYFTVRGDSLPMRTLGAATQAVRTQLAAAFPNCSCELIAVPDADSSGPSATVR